MNYEKKYKEALERARDMMSYKEVRREDMEYLFPELKESEDERIRKQIISFLKEFEYDHYRCLDFSSWIAWLEKQGDKDKFIEKELGHIKGYRENAIKRIEELKKQCEHKPIDKVEPKFKVGDWVVWDNKISCHIDNICQGKESLMYAITDTNNMVRTYSVKGFDNNAHLWTIQDAKDGDVLVASDNSVFIFARVDGHVCVHHITLASDGTLKINPRLNGAWESVEGVKPATKEQRYLLFQKMKEEGYEWNKDKKKLIKL